MESAAHRSFPLASTGGLRDVDFNEATSVAWIAERADERKCVRECAAVDIAELQRTIGRDELTIVFYCDRPDHAADWDLEGGYEYPPDFERASIAKVVGTEPDMLGIVDEKKARELFAGAVSEVEIREAARALGSKVSLGEYVAGSHWLGLADEVHEATAGQLTYSDGKTAPMRSYRFSVAKTKLIVDAAARYGASTWGFEAPGELVYTEGLHVVVNAEPTLKPPRSPHLRIVL